MPSLDLTPINLIIGFGLLCISPIIMISLPFLFFPLLFLYLIYYLVLPVKPAKSPLRSVEVGDAKPNEGRPRRWATHPTIVTRWSDGIDTIPAVLAAAVEKFGSRRALGIRRTIRVEEKIVKKKVDGKDVEQRHRTPWQSDYEWRTYTQLYDEVQRLGRGLLAHHVEFGQRVALFAATRPEWQIAAQACFLHGLPIVTIYPSLGVDALVYCMNQTSVQHVITQVDKLDLVIQTASQVTSLKYVLFFDELSTEKRAEYEAKTRLQLISYAQLLQAGALSKARPSREVKGSDVAVIMYTSGSTGNPKGVVMTHQNVLSAAFSVNYVPPKALDHDDVYIAYLPLAHVLELAAETLFLGVGASIGYSSPLTLNGTGVKDAEGKPAGDLEKLRPTIMAAVPLILDRLKAAVTDTVNKSGLVQRAVFHLAFYLKQRNYLRKQASPILDRIVFRKIAAKMGGRVRYLLSGGAPLSQDTQRFINVVFCTPVLQGYGLTETLAANAITHPDDVTTGNVGAPIPSCEIKLVDVPEMGYRSSDVDKDGKAAPKGEIVIRGGCVAPGYFDLPEQTAEVFEKGRGKGDDALSWFHTGDIGQWREDGTLMIIDRKKDLVKLAHGEYIALGNLESVYAHCPLVEHICIYADADHQRPIAIVVPNKAALQGLAAQKGTKGSDALQSSAVREAVVADLGKYAAARKLEKWERIAAVYLTEDEWSPQTGLLTEAMKLKRHEIKKKYKQQIADTYKGVE